MKDDSPATCKHVGLQGGHNVADLRFSYGRVGQILLRNVFGDREIERSNPTVQKRDPH